jgi:hypothetical protein
LPHPQIIDQGKQNGGRLSFLARAVEFYPWQMAAYFAFIQCGGGNERNVSGSQVTPQRIRGLDAIGLWHRYIHDDEVELPRQPHVNRLRAAQRDPTLYGLNRQIRRQGLGSCWDLVDNQYV